MKLFIDSANFGEIESALSRGFVSGITTNPSILAKEEKSDFREHIRGIINLVQQYGEDIPLSVEVFTADPKEMIAQAEQFVEHFGDYTKLAIKIPIGWDELGVINQLRKRGIRVNCTCCMNFNQAMMAANAGANYVSLFWGRVKDTGADPSPLVSQVREALAMGGSDAEIIVGSIRHLQDVNEAIQAGTHIVTVPPQFFRPMVKHPKTDEAVQQFLTDFQAWLS